MRRAAALLAVLMVPAAAHAYEVDERVVAQPEVQYHVSLPDWRKPFDRVVRALNRAKVGVELVEAEIPQNASIQVGRLKRRCGLPGVDATTQTLAGGFAAIYLPFGCKGTKASILAAHELGHALGLLHEDDVCALMNSSGTGRLGTPTECLGERHPWRTRPWREDDLKGLRRLYRNEPPKATLRPGGTTGLTAAFTATARDENLSEVRFDYGDGTMDEVVAGQPLPTSHGYDEAGTYRIRMTALDYYGKRDTAVITVRVG